MIPIILRKYRTYFWYFTLEGVFYMEESYLSLIFILPKLPIEHLAYDYPQINCRIFSKYFSKLHIKIDNFFYKYYDVKDIL